MVLRKMRGVNLILLLFFGNSVLLGCSKNEGKDLNQNTNPDTEQTDSPKIQSLEPATANPGDTVLVNGVNFGNNASVVSVAFNDKSAQVISVADVKIKMIVPPPGDKDWSNVIVKVSGKSSNSFLFTYSIVTPKIDSLSASVVPAGTNIEILGSGFGNKEGNVTVTFGDNPVSVTSVEDKSIRVVVPPYSGEKSVEVQVTVKSYKSNKVAFYYKNVSYNNPVSNTSLPDPTLIKGQDGWFYLYATEDTRGMPIMRSKDLTDWVWTGLTVFNDNTRPAWLSGGGLWAPDINYINNKYVLYYALSTWGEVHANGIGIATADDPKGPFADRGKLFTSDEIGVVNSIDPDLFVDDDGRKYLFWGSLGGGLYMIEMSTDGLSIKQGAVKQKVAGNGMEGVYIYKKGNYYYLFASVGSCCAGINSTYQLVVGRSLNLTGPYVSKSGDALLDGNYTVVISGNNTFAGPGHCSQIIKDSDGNDWILYHAIDKKNSAQFSWRMLMLDRLYWDNDAWPYIGNNGTPSTTEPGPFFITE
ncbi:MAG: family 43 glycosylhydrolase [Ginsengibacter sp.]